MTPADLADLVRAVAVDVLDERGLDTAVLPETVTVARPRRPEHGDYATALALHAGPRVGVEPVEFARCMAERLAGTVSAEVAGPGFLNLRLGPQTDVVAEILAEDDAPVIAGGEPPPAALVDAVGVDAARYALVRRVDVELLGRQIVENPFFSVRWAHARLAGAARSAVDLGVAGTPDLTLLTHPRESDLMATMGEYPRAAPPRRVARHLEDLADAAHRFLDTCRVLPQGDEEPAPPHTARLALGTAARRVLAHGLGRLGVSAPERL